MTLTVAVSGLRVNTRQNVWGPGWFPEVSLCRLRPSADQMSCPAIFLSVTPPEMGTTGDLSWYLWKWHVLLLFFLFPQYIIFFSTVQHDACVVLMFITMEVGCYCRTGLHLLCMSPVPLRKSKFSKAPFRCSSPFLLTGLEALPQEEARNGQGNHLPRGFLWFWSQSSCYEIEVSGFFLLSSGIVRCLCLLLFPMLVPYTLNNKMKKQRMEFQPFLCPFCPLTSYCCFATPVSPSHMLATHYLHPLLPRQVLSDGFWELDGVPPPALWQNRVQIPSPA